MSRDVMNHLMKTVRASIAEMESTTAQLPQERALRLALAHLWSAYDELELRSTAFRGHADRAARVE